MGVGDPWVRQFAEYLAPLSRVGAKI